MAKMWAGRTGGVTDPAADSFNSSISFDFRMFEEDIRGSAAHAAMLGRQGILPAADVEKIIKCLGEIADEIRGGTLLPDMSAEDVHMFIESVLTERIGDAGRRLHTARSRNDQVACDLRLYLRGQSEKAIGLLCGLVGAIYTLAGEHTRTVMPGYTHLQRAQPVSFAFHLLAYAQMFMRDVSRLHDAAARMNYSPLGACALSGTTYPTDRRSAAAELGFDGVCANAADAVSDRDFVVELEASLALIMTHLSRLSEEIVLFSSWEFGFIELDDAYTTGSSIMPQKKNSDMAELIRGKTGRVNGDLVATLTMLKGLPLAYNKDMQEDKEAVFDAFDTTLACLSIMTPMIATMKVKKEKMRAAAAQGYINATDLADYLTRRGMPFREAYGLVGRAVALCIGRGVTLDELPLGEYRALSPLFDGDLYDAINLEACIARRVSEGSTGYDSVASQLSSVGEWLKTKGVSTDSGC